MDGSTEIDTTAPSTIAVDKAPAAPNGSMATISTAASAIIANTERRGRRIATAVTTTPSASVIAVRLASVTPYVASRPTRSWAYPRPSCACSGVSLPRTAMTSAKRHIARQAGTRTFQAPGRNTCVRKVQTAEKGPPSA